MYPIWSHCFPVHQIDEGILAIDGADSATTGHWNDASQNSSASVHGDFGQPGSDDPFGDVA